jgi:hypothetical protein
LPYSFLALPYTISALPYTFSALPYTISALPYTFSALPYTFSALPYTFSALPYTAAYGSLLLPVLRTCALDAAIEAASSSFAECKLADMELLSTP